MTHHRVSALSVFFFFNDTATTEIYTLSLHDALPIFARKGKEHGSRKMERYEPRGKHAGRLWRGARGHSDRKSTRLNSSHLVISYAVFCLKKKKKPDARDRDSPIHHRG